MYKFIFSFFILMSGITAHTQSIKKYAIGNSGCSLNMYCETKFEMSKSQDSSLIYTGECKNDEVSYGVICVKLLTPVTDLKMAEDLLVSYADYLKESFEITKSTGYGLGHLLNNNEQTRGIVDYWEDADNNKWKIKGWTDGRFIGFVYSFSAKTLPEGKINVFLDSFRLPGN